MILPWQDVFNKSKIASAVKYDWFCKNGISCRYSNKIISEAVMTRKYEIMAKLEIINSHSTGVYVWHTFLNMSFIFIVSLIN